MRILHLDPDDMDNPLSGGGPVRNFEIYRRLARRHDVTILTPTFAGSTPEKEREGIRYIRLGRKIRNHGSSHHITFFFELPRAIRRFEHDLLVEDFMPPMSATFNPLFARKPMVASVQWFFARTLADQFKLPFHWGEKYLIRLYRNFIVLTETMRRTIVKRHPRARCAIIPNGVEESLFSLTPRAGNFILYLGRVDFGQKGVDLLLEAFAKIPPAERLPLFLAGHGYEWDRLNEMVGRLELGPWVQTLGKVDSARRAQLYEDCRFVVVPSRDETFGMVITEACAAGKQVVLFNQPPMNEVAPPGASELASPYNVEEFAAGMRRLIHAADQELLHKAQVCRAWAQKFHWDALALEQEKFYMQVVEDAHP
ncbi:MAG: glycosyltransferase family 4 protein [Planctomycetota bacterium]